MENTRITSDGVQLSVAKDHVFLPSPAVMGAQQHRSAGKYHTQLEVVHVAERHQVPTQASGHRLTAGEAATRSHDTSADKDLRWSSTVAGCHGHPALIVL